MTINKDQIDKLKAEHGDDIHVIDGFDVAFTKPARGDYKRFVTDAANPAKRADALEMLARSVVVHPDKEAFLDLLDEYPGVGPKVANAAVMLAAKEQPDFAKKA